MPELAFIIILKQKLMWKEDFSSLLSAMKEFIVELWELRKPKIYSNKSCPSLHFDSLGWDLGKGGSCTLGGRNDGSGKLNVPVVWLVGMVGMVSKVLMHVQVLVQEFQMLL